jgi:hypothetical protein
LQLRSAFVAARTAVQRRSILLAVNPARPARRYLQEQRSGGGACGLDSPAAVQARLLQLVGRQAHLLDGCRVCQRLVEREARA